MVKLCNRVEPILKKYRITITDLQSTDKWKDLVQARAVFARAAQLSGLSLLSVSQFLNKHHGTVSKLAKQARQKKNLNELAIGIVEKIAK
ncbi:MAG: hypothetical protein KDK65_05870 [Chlamydiia bacterium]|nr:hypothetical protein [Chlamydiia bacterium]